MNIAIAVLVAILTGSMALPSTIEHGATIAAESKAGMRILSKARRVEADEDEDLAWIADYSLKFLGCHHVSQWNNAEDEEDEENDGQDSVRIQTKRLVRFRLCPTDYCNNESGVGCSSGYGDYIVDMNTFVQDYTENNCEYTKDYVCGCENGNDDRDQCEKYCYMERGLDYCIDDNADDAVQQIDIKEYMQCNEFDVQGDDNARRLNEEDDRYFVGPYCAAQGGKIYLGMFTDNTCTTFADEYGGKDLYEDLVGQSLPYSSTSIIRKDCFNCMEPQDGNDQADEANEFCTDLYSESGKCENELGINDPNENACTYMQGIKITRSNGIIMAGDANKNKLAMAFIGIFAVSFVLLGAYVYYLKTKLDRAKINLSD